MTLTVLAKYLLAMGPTSPDSPFWALTGLFRPQILSSPDTS